MFEFMYSLRIRIQLSSTALSCAIIIFHWMHFFFAVFVLHLMYSHVWFIILLCFPMIVATCNEFQFTRYFIAFQLSVYFIWICDFSCCCCCCCCCTHIHVHNGWRIWGHCDRWLVRKNCLHNGSCQNGTFTRQTEYGIWGALPHHRYINRFGVCVVWCVSFYPDCFCT